MAGQRVEVDGGIMEGVSARPEAEGWRQRPGPERAEPPRLTSSLCLRTRTLAAQGGQILRVSTALSCLLGLPLHVQKIRAGRSTPGLR